MSAKFCLLIPSKVLQVDKHFSEKFQLWLKYHKKIDNSILSSDCLYSFSDFQKRPDVHLDLPDNFFARYHVIDWGFDFPSDVILRSFLDWLAEIYIYGEVGLLKYWSDQKGRFPPVIIGQIDKQLSDLSIDDLPLDKLLFFTSRADRETKN
jgi:hypothetical protein